MPLPAYLHCFTCNTSFVSANASIRTWDLGLAGEVNSCGDCRLQSRPYLQVHTYFVVHAFLLAAISSRINGVMIGDLGCLHALNA